MGKLLSLGMIVFLFSACKSEEKEDLVNVVPKDGSIETIVKVEHLNDSLDLLVTNHTVYKNPANVKIFTSTDTIPSLGKTSVTDNNDNSKLVQKDYDIYITVK